MFRLDVRTNLDQYSRDLDDLARTQLPFAEARTLTLTARDARDDVRKGLGNKFVLRSKWVERGIQSVSATKQLPVAMVGSRDWFMADQEEGGRRRPLTGMHRAAPLGVRTSPRQRITKAKRPPRLLAKRRFFLQRLARGRHKGQFAVMRRVSRSRYPLQVLYLLERETKIRPKFRFRETVERTVDRRLSQNFGRSLARALATRRR